MEIILLERIASLGQMGEVVSVKPGYARNFLLPQKKALRATKENLVLFESRRSQLEAENLERKTEAEAVGAKMDKTSVVLIRAAGESGQLYGSVSPRDIAEIVTEEGFTISRQQVQLAKPIKTLGLFDVDIVLHPEVTVGVIVNVARSEDEAVTQAKRGGALVGEDAFAAMDEDFGDQSGEAAPAEDDEAPEEAMAADATEAPEAAPEPDAAGETDAGEAVAEE